MPSLNHADGLLSDKLMFSPVSKQLFIYMDENTYMGVHVPHASRYLLNVYRCKYTMFSPVSMLLITKALNLWHIIESIKTTSMEDVSTRVLEEIKNI